MYLTTAFLKVKLRPLRLHAPGVLLSSSAREDTVVMVPPPTPPLPRMVTNPEVEDSIVYYPHAFLPDDNGGDGRSASYSCVMMGYSNLQTTVHLYELQDWYWVLRASAAAQLRVSPPRSKVVLADENRFYMLSTINKILVCDFQLSSISAMELPDGVEEGHTGRIMLSRGDGSGIYLIHVEESHLRVFHSGGDLLDPGKSYQLARTAHDSGNCRWAISGRK